MVTPTFETLPVEREYLNSYDNDGRLITINSLTGNKIDISITYEERFIADGDLDTVMMNLKLCGLLLS